MILLLLLDCSIGTKRALWKGLVCLSLRRVSSKWPLSLFCSCVYEEYCYCFTVDLHIWRAFEMRGSAMLHLLFPVVEDCAWSCPLKGLLPVLLTAVHLLISAYMASFPGLCAQTHMSLVSEKEHPWFTHPFPPRPQNMNGQNTEGCIRVSDWKLAVLRLTALPGASLGKWNACDPFLPLLGFLLMSFGLLE